MDTEPPMTAAMASARAYSSSLVPPAFGDSVIRTGEV